MGTENRFRCIFIFGSWRIRGGLLLYSQWPWIANPVWKQIRFDSKPVSLQTGFIVTDFDPKPVLVTSPNRVSNCFRSAIPTEATRFKAWVQVWSIFADFRFDFHRFS